MPRTPDRDPGVSQEEGIVLSDEGVDPAVVGEVRNNGGTLKAKDSVGTFNLRTGGGGGNALVHKAGQVAVGSFTGTPKRATVTFASAFADASYGVVVTPRSQNAKTFAPVVESQLAGSFIINMETNNVADLLSANWVAMKNGES